MSNKITVSMREKLIADLEELKTVKRLEIADKIKEARSFGDLSENSEYDEAKNEQAKIESRIAEIEDILSRSTIIDDHVKTDIVDVGCKVKLFDEVYKEEVEFLIVGSTEANPIENRISDESPIGKALMGKKKGETISVDTPGGETKLTVLLISVPK